MRTSSAHTSFSEGRDAEDVRELLSRYFEAARTVIERYGGMVEKFIGDAVMAVWGTPVAQEDDAERAVRAALDLLAAVAALGADVGAPELQARAGVLTGEAAVTLGAEGQGMVAGDLVNTASRIQAAAEPGAVLVGDVTKRASEAAIVFEDAGAHSLKGKVEPVELWQAVRVVGLRGGAAQSTASSRHSSGAIASSASSRSSFTPPPRIADRISCLSSASAASASRGSAGSSRSTSTGSRATCGGIGTLSRLRRRGCLLGARRDGPRTSRDPRGRGGGISPARSFAGQSKRTSPIRTSADSLEPRLAHLLGLEEGAVGDQENLFAAARIFFERLAETGPAVLVFEDIHWADSALLDFIEYLVEWSRDVPLFVLTLSRPELQDRRPTWGSGKRNFTSIFLDPLSADAMEALLTGPVPGLTEELRERILERAEGVPFYAVETVRMLLDRGVLVREGHSYRLTGEIETLEVPETLQALIAARLDGLTGGASQLQHASVLGRTFTLPGLSSVSGRRGDRLAPILRPSCARKSSRSPPTRSHPSAVSTAFCRTS